jgi:hypothetical protein
MATTASSWVDVQTILASASGERKHLPENDGFAARLRRIHLDPGIRGGE